MKIFLGFFVFFLGASLGSFLAVITDRLPRGENFCRGRSYCFSCQKEIPAYYNIPLISYLWLRGKCPFCGQKIPFFCFIAELTSGLVWLLFFLKYFPNHPFLLTRSLLLSGFLLLIFFYDARWGLILDVFIWPALILAFLTPFFSSQFSLPNIFFGAIIGGSFFYLQYFFSRGEWVGGGDVRLGFLLGAILGWRYLLFALLVAYCLGGAAAIILLVSKRKGWKSVVPFGPFLVAAAFITMLAGPYLWHLYNNFLGNVFF